ncbi:sugar phosphate isomerase/epimerase family protein [Spirabiliibacterium falconis]|uniref:sugar phosphate isomerase/epimerase family protein n=1 Tax=Spirabiliibacterium falconis TaxID=572023 RepID=UPI001AACDD39|nr:sugar phosphate isomerase/epimerase family protein [Spirabiliibacterium falconis]MBE2895117.1 sugar phosphate isomerase/epimerase [Spirabiliibacterium falconis]
MKIGLETESCHLLFQHGKMDVFSFIDTAWELGLDGVELNIIPDLNLHPELGVLESDDKAYLHRIREKLERYNLYCEIDTRFCHKESLLRGLKIANELGADVVRTYVSNGNFNPERMALAPAQLKEIVPYLKKYRIKLALENHEHETSDEIINIIKAVNSIWVGAHCDIGNSMMAWEDPVAAVTALAPYTYSTHFKDHIITLHDDIPVVCGVPIGKGSIDIDTCFKLLVDHSPVTRINIENCYPYCAKFARPIGTGGVRHLDGAFEIKPPPFSPDFIKPLDYYYPHTISQEALDTLTQAQINALHISIGALNKLKQKYCAC